MPRHHHHEDRNDLAKEFPYNDQIQITLALLFVAVLLLDFLVFHVSWPLSGALSLPIRAAIAAVIFVIGGYYAKKGGDIVFGEERKSISVISHGVFGHVRHPLYFGSIMAYLAFVLLSLSLPGLVLMIISIIFYIISCRYEERELIGILGDEYLEYMKRVPMLFPLPFRRGR